MFGWIIKFITGGGLSGIAGELRQAHKDKLDAANDTDRIAAEVTIVQLQVRQRAMVEGKWTWLPKLVRGLVVAPFILFIWKVIVWDNLLQLGATDPMSERMYTVMNLSLTYYFLSTVTEGVIRKFKK
ncbi:MAG: hypothetical protein COA63_014115 [Methylophaga sp.]|nr:hypothetical protein [Methylophaga sp.]